MSADVEQCASGFRSRPVTPFLDLHLVALLDLLMSMNRYGAGTSECYCMRKTGGIAAPNVSEKK